MPSSATTNRSPERTAPEIQRTLDTFIKHTHTQKYNGKTAARLVLFSPIAHENLHDRNLPDGTDNNRRLELYTAALAEVAAGQPWPFHRPLHETTPRAIPCGQAAHDQRCPTQRALGDKQLADVIDRPALRRDTGAAAASPSAGEASSGRSLDRRPH